VGEFMGIEQAGMGAELAKMERDTHLVNENIHKIFGKIYFNEKIYSC